ncbi:MAG: oxygenase MpaB family protein [Solirubrobacterales bacterium]
MARYFDDDSMMRRVYRERALALAGPRALLMQAAHPLAVSGLLAHTSALDEPYERLARTAEVMSTITFGTRAEADRVTRRVRAMHRRVSGTLDRPVGRFPAGTPYRASDPELLMWVLYTLVDSAVVVYRKYVGGMIRAAQADFWDDYRVVGRLLGLSTSDMPATLSDLEDYGRGMLAGDDLHVNAWARTRAREIVLEPPVPLALRPVVEAVNFVTITLLPERIRREYGFRALPPAWARRAIVSGGAEYVKRAVIPLLPERLRVVPAARAA